MNAQEIIHENLLWALIEADLSEAEMERLKIAVVRLFGHVGELTGGTELYREAVKVGYDALPAQKQAMFQRLLKKAAEMMDVSGSDQKKVVEFAMAALPGRTRRAGYTAPGSKPTTLAASLEQAAAGLTEGLVLGAKDKAVLDAFGNKKAAEGKKLSTDGTTLDGNWMGGKKLAFWQGEKIHFGAGRPHVKSDEVVMRAIRKYATGFDMAESAELELIEKAPPGWAGTVKAMKKHMPTEKAFKLAWHGYKSGKQPHYKDEDSTTSDGEPTKKKGYEAEACGCEGPRITQGCDCKDCKKKRAALGEDVDDDRDFFDDPSDMARMGTEGESAVPRTPGPIGKPNTVVDQRPEQASAKSSNSIADELAGAIDKGMEATGPANDDTGTIEPDRGNLGANEFKWPEVVGRYQDAIMGEGLSPDEAFSLALTEDGLVDAPVESDIIDFIVSKQGRLSMEELQQKFPVTDGWAGKLLLTAAAAFGGVGVGEDKRRQADPAGWFREKAQPILVAMADGEQVAEDYAIGDGALNAAGAASSQSAGYEPPYDMGGNRDLAVEQPADSDVLAALITDGETQDNSTAPMRTVEPRGVGKANKPTAYTAEDKASDHVKAKLTGDGWIPLGDLARGYKGHFRDVMGAANALVKKGVAKHKKDDREGDMYRLSEAIDDYPVEDRIRMAEAYDMLLGGAQNLSKEQKVDGEKYKALITKRASRATGTSNEPAKPARQEVPEEVETDGIMPEVLEALGDAHAMSPADRYRAGEKLDTIIDELRAERRRLTAKNDAIVGEAKSRFDEIQKNLDFIRKALTPRHEDSDDAFEDALVMEAGGLGESAGHHYFDGKSYSADTAFMNAMHTIMPGQEMKHMGFGEFEWVGPEGRVDFDRMRGKDFPGQSGRSHKLYDDQDGKLVKKLIAAMEKKGKSELVKESLDEGLKSTKVSRWVEAKMPGPIGGWMSAWLVKLEGKHAWVQFSDDAPNRRVSMGDVREIKESLDEAATKPLKGKKLDAEIDRLFKKHGDRVRFNIMDLGKIRRAGTDAATAGQDIEAAVVAAIKKYRVAEGVTLDESSRVGQFFVIVDKKTGQATSPIYQGSARADAELKKRGGESKTGQQVMDAMWHNPSRAKLKHSGTIGEGMASALQAAAS